jgi:hypothetical protein
MNKATDDPTRHEKKIKSFRLKQRGLIFSIDIIKERKKVSEFMYRNTIKAKQLLIKCNDLRTKADSFIKIFNLVDFVGIFFLLDSGVFFHTQPVVGDLFATTNINLCNFFLFVCATTSALKNC